MATRRQQTERLLSGRNSANPVEFTSDFNLRPDAPQGVGGVQQARQVRDTNFDAQQTVLNGLAEFGSNLIQSAAKRRYETLQMDGAIAQTQGKSVDELPMDGNKWMLEGYHVMEAESASAALLTAQRAEISASLYEQDPDAFRARYVQRTDEALAGKDPRVQELIKQAIAKNMPSLVEQHTREHANFLERKNTEAVSTSIDMLSRDPTKTDQLLSFAKGEGAAGALSFEKREEAVIDGVVQAYANNNPVAYAVLQDAGMFDSLTTEQASKLDAAKKRYNSEAKSKYSATRMQEEQALLMQIEQGTDDPMAVVEKYIDLQAKYGIEVDMAEASSVYGAATEAEAMHSTALSYDIKTAAMNKDYDRVAELTANAANNVSRGATKPTYEHNTQIDFQLGPNRPNRPLQPVLDVIGKSVEDVFGQGAKVVVTSGQEDEGKQHGSNRHGTGHAADIAIYRPDGSRVKATDGDMAAFAKTAARNGATGIGFGAEYMGGEHIHVDLTTPGQGQGHTWASGAKAIAGDLTGIMSSRRAASGAADLDPAKWATAVQYAKGDVALAAVVYRDGKETADAWVAGGRKPEELNANTAAFSESIMYEVSGERFTTAKDRAVRAEATYKAVRDRNAVEAYGGYQREFAVMSDTYIKGGMSQQEFIASSDEARARWGIDTTKADIDAELSASEKRGAAIQKEAEEAGEEAYAKTTTAFNLERKTLDDTLAEAISSIADMSKPENMSQSEFLAQQKAGMELAAKQHQGMVTALADEKGIKWADRKIEQSVEGTVKKTRSGMEAALKNAQNSALIERALTTGTLDSLPADLQKKAYADALPQINEQTRQYANEPNADGSTRSEDQVQEFRQGALEDWYVRAGQVPEEVRTQMSGPLRGQIILQTGEVNPAAQAAITAYRDLRVKSPHAAKSMLDDDVRVIADAVLDATNGSEEAIPRILASMWAEGLGNKFQGKPDPDFSQRGDVQNAISKAIGGGAIRALTTLVLPKTAFETANIPASQRDMVSSLMSEQVQKLHAAQPGMNPSWLIKQAERAVLRGTVPVKADPAGPDDENYIVTDMSGGDIWAQTFGNAADQYSADRSAFSTALDGYVQSPDFVSRYGSVVPQTSMLETLRTGLPFTTPSDVQRAALGGRGAYKVNMIGNGKAWVDFTMDADGSVKTVIVPLNEIGDWYKTNDMQKLTK